VDVTILPAFIAPPNEAELPTPVKNEKKHKEKTLVDSCPEFIAIEIVRF
jgi:hypothetical protein